MPDVPVLTTGPQASDRTTIAGLGKRLQAAETNISRLLANRKAENRLLHQLGNTDPMSQVQDGQTLIYDAATGKYKPGSSVAGGYASLTGPGQLVSPGALSQDGAFTIEGPLTVNATGPGAGNIALNSALSIALAAAHNLSESFTGEYDLFGVTTSSNLIRVAWDGLRYNYAWDAGDYMVDSSRTAIINAATDTLDMGSGVPSLSGALGVLLAAQHASLLVGAGVGHDASSVTLDAPGGASSHPIEFFTCTSTTSLPGTTSFPAFAFTTLGHIYFNGGGGPWTLVV